MVWTSFGLLPRAKFHIYRGNVSPVWGEKPIFGLLSKNSTGMAALSNTNFGGCTPTFFNRQ